MRKNKVIPLMMVLVLGLALVTGCVSKEKVQAAHSSELGTPQGDGQQTNTMQTAENIVLQGSMNALPLMLELTNGLPYDVAAVGKEASIEAVLSGTAALSLYDGSIEEGQGLTEVIAYAGVLLIVHEASSLDSVTVEEVRAFFTGETDTIGGKRLERVLPAQGVASRMLFEELFPLKGDVNGMQQSLIPDTALVCDTDEQVLTEVANNPNAIGVIMTGYLNEQVKGLKIEGIEASKATMAEGTYMATKPLVLMAQASNKELFDAFIEVVKSEKGIESIEKVGYVSAY